MTCFFDWLPVVFSFLFIVVKERLHMKSWSLDVFCCVRELIEACRQLCVGMAFTQVPNLFRVAIQFCGSKIIKNPSTFLD